MTEHFDLVIVGGGIGGAALATVAARARLSALVIEKSTVYRDHVRGEWIAPWGVIELIELGLYDAVRAGGGHHLSRHQALDEEVPAEDAVLQALDLTMLVPGVPGPLCLGHPAFCQLLIEQAAGAGAVVRRDGDDVQVTLGPRPSVTYQHDGARRQATGRLIVGADGRGSVVRRQAGITLHRDPTHHLFGGMLVDGADAWPSDLQVIGSAHDVHFLVFPQGNGRARLYLGYRSDQARRFAGASGPQAFLDAFRLQCVPGSKHLATARPAGPCNSYPNEDTWTDRLAEQGLVLIGDAAGSNDPIIGQGLSITLRDVHMVRDALLGEREWSPRIFEPYAAERAERMQRLRLVASIVSILQNEFGPEASERRRRVHARRMQDPSIILPLMAAFVGPGNVPAEVFAGPVRERFLAAEAG
jgi:2-polyprenyl-6-methoxyphenol hydroxylase-like FAD-dependent oxidoreductase